MTMDTNHNYSLATEDDEYPQGFSDEPEYEEDESLWDEYDYYDFPETEDDGPWYDPQDGDYL